MKKIVIIFIFALSFVSNAEDLAVKAPLAESEIPVHLETVKKSTNTDSPWARMFMGIAIAGILSAGAFVLIRRAKNKNGVKNTATQIKVLTQHYLGPKKSLAIIRVAGESILIGVTDQNISLIKELSLIDDEIPTQVPKDFNQSLEDAEDFSMTGIKDFVSTKLKSMRTIQ